MDIKSIITPLLGAFLLVSTASAAPKAGIDPQEELADLVERIRPSVVTIEMTFGAPALGTSLNRNAPRRPMGKGRSSAGSGVLVSPEGHILTNFHVVGKATTIEVGLPGGEKYEAKRLGSDPLGDVSMIKIERDTPFPHAVLGNSDALEVGQWAAAMGNPWRSAVSNYEPTFTFGVISGLHRYNAQGQFIYGNSIQIDAQINPGNSGGPLFNRAGELVGINGKIHVRRGRVNSGIGYAIPINQIKGYLEDLKEGKTVEHGWIGVNGKDPRKGGVEITEVTEEGPAEKAGLNVGDRILSCNGTVTHETTDLLNFLAPLTAGATITLKIERDGEEKTVEVTLEKRPQPKRRQPEAPQEEPEPEEEPHEGD